MGHHASRPSRRWKDNFCEIYIRPHAMHMATVAQLSASYSTPNGDADSLISFSKEHGPYDCGNTTKNGDDLPVSIMGYEFEVPTNWNVYKCTRDGWTYDCGKETLENRDEL
eukprot:255113_1